MPSSEPCHLAERRIPTRPAPGVQNRLGVLQQLRPGGGELMSLRVRVNRGPQRFLEQRIRVLTATASGRDSPRLSKMTGTIDFEEGFKEVDIHLIPKIFIKTIISFRFIGASPPYKDASQAMLDFKLCFESQSRFDRLHQPSRWIDGFAPFHGSVHGLAPGFCRRLLPSLLPSLVLRRITHRRYIEEKKRARTKNSAKPGGKHITDRLVHAPVLTRTATNCFRDIISPSKITGSILHDRCQASFDQYVRHIPTPLRLHLRQYHHLVVAEKRLHQIIEDCFCLFSLNGHCLTAQLPPQACTSGGGADACFRIMDGYNPTAYLSAVEYVPRFYEPARGIPDRWLIERSLPTTSTTEIWSSQGHAYKTKREINQFRRVHPDHRLERLGRNMRTASAGHRYLVAQSISYVGRCHRRFFTRSSRSAGRSSAR
jgi:hypothetical protein